MRIRTVALVILFNATALVVLSAGPASAAPFTVDIKAGNTAQTIGTLTIERVADGDGTETLHLTATVPGGIKDTYVCLSGTVFTERVSPGQCPYSQGSTGTTATYVIDVGDTYVGGALHIQFHVTVPGASAYAGWQPGSPFFGEVGVPPVGPPTTVPMGPLGLYGLAGVLGLVWVGSRRLGSRRLGVGRG